MAQAEGNLNEDQEQVETADKIAEQNDRFRNTWGADFTVPGQIVMTRGVADLSRHDRREARSGASEP